MSPTLQEIPTTDFNSALEAQTLSDGRSLAEASYQETILLVFLRHLG